MPTRVLAVWLVILAGVSCARDVDHQRSETGWVGTVDSTADSVVLLNSNPYDSDWPPRSMVDSASVIFDSEELFRPSHVIMSPTGELVVADRERLLIVDTIAKSVRTVGRGGKGPGEYGRIHGVFLWPGDSILVFDGYQLRLTWHAWNGSVIRTQPLSPSRWERATGRRTDLHVVDGTVVLAWAPNLVRPGGPPDTVVLEALNIDADAGRTVALVEDVSWVRSPTITGPRFPFGSRALYGVSHAGTVVYSEGVDYCFTIRPLAPMPLRHVCREWMRQPVGTAGAPPAAIADDELGRLGSALPPLVAVQEFGPHMNSIEEIRIDDEERVWVRVVDSTYKDHPFYLANLPRIRPSFYTWEIFDPSGRLTARIALPSRFSPLDFVDGVAFGTLVRDDGTIALASVRYDDSHRVN